MILATLNEIIVAVIDYYTVDIAYLTLRNNILLLHEQLLEKGLDIYIQECLEKGIDPIENIIEMLKPVNDLEQQALIKQREFMQKYLFVGFGVWCLSVILIYGFTTNMPQNMQNVPNMIVPPQPVDISFFKPTQGG